MKKQILGVGMMVAIGAAAAPALAQSAGVTGHEAIPALPTPNIGAAFRDLSGDGTTIAGVVRRDATNHEAYRITASGYERLNGLSGHAYVLANGVSDDGRVIVGVSQTGSATRGSAIIWEGTVLTELGHLATSASVQNSLAFGVSGNGQVAVGSSTIDNGTTHAVRWIEKGVAQDLHGGSFAYSIAQRASRDGGVIIGYGGTSARTNEAFAWTASGGMQGLGILASQSADAGAYSRATDVSADGGTIVGFSAGSNDRAQAFRWNNSSGGMVSLGLLEGGTDSRAYAVNADGSVIVGSATRPSTVVPSIQDTLAMRWTSTTGIQTVVAWLTSAGVSVGSDSFTDAVAISDDGRTIIGTGQINGKTQEYIARDCQDFRVWPGIMGNKESHYVTTQRTCHTE